MRSGSSDRVTINGQGGVATWQLVERLIPRRIKTIDPHLKRGGGGRVRAALSLVDKAF